ncbi:MAG: flagellar biosynthesis anti-sigma factor FlgM [Clostridiales bacterium]|jgi:negative regulator of flagellin synthesis FlgM|nr:flagellar biosynthesis anti-sigma factor FlgM [Clostridiales bacterium]
MRIEAYNKVSQVYGASNVKKLAKTKEKSFSDMLEISQAGKDYRVANQIVKQTPDVREDKINDIKMRMESGTYNVNMSEVADKVVKRYFDELV